MPKLGSTFSICALLMGANIDGKVKPTSRISRAATIATTRFPSGPASTATPKRCSRERFCPHFTRGLDIPLGETGAVPSTPKPTTTNIRKPGQ